MTRAIAWSTADPAAEGVAVGAIAELLVEETLDDSVLLLLLVNELLADSLVLLPELVGEAAVPVSLP